MLVGVVAVINLALGLAVGIRLWLLQRRDASPVGRRVEMSLDFEVGLPCEPKRVLGAGDARKGGARLDVLLAARNRAELIERLAAESSADPRTLPFTHVVMDEKGRRTERRLDYDALRAEASELVPLAPTCTGCPANLAGEAFGCEITINYPVRAAAEEWLMEQIEEPGTLGATLCLSAMKDFRYGGAPVRRLRKSGLFERSSTVSRKLGTGLFGGTVTSDQILEAVCAVGKEVAPAHAFTVLAWFGALIVDGKVPRAQQDAALLMRIVAMDTPEKRAQVELNVSEPDDEMPGSAQMAMLLRALHRCWLLDVPLIVLG